MQSWYEDFELKPAGIASFSCETLECTVINMISIFVTPLCVSHIWTQSELLQPFSYASEESVYTYFHGFFLSLQ